MNLVVCVFPDCDYYYYYLFIANLSTAKRQMNKYTVPNKNTMFDLTCQNLKMMVTEYQ
jgi:hypothetical protein